MDYEVTALARRLADELTELDARLPAKIEAAILLHGQELAEERYDADTMVALAGLVVAVAQFAYQIYRDRHKDRQLRPEALKRQLHGELDDQGFPDTAHRASVVEAVVRIIERQER